MSGTMPPLKILLCFTWPASTACVTPASCSSRMQVPSCPSEIQWDGGAVARRGAVQFGKRLFLGRHDGHVVPLRARGGEHEKGECPVAGDEPQSHAARHLQRPLPSRMKHELSCGRWRCPPGKAGQEMQE
jgi:hypothetical protein